MKQIKSWLEIFLHMHFNACNAVSSIQNEEYVYEERCDETTLINRHDNVAVT